MTSVKLLSDPANSLLIGFICFDGVERIIRVKYSYPLLTD